MVLNTNVWLLLLLMFFCCCRCCCCCDAQVSFQRNRISVSRLFFGFNEVHSRRKKVFKPKKKTLRREISKFLSNETKNEFFLPFEFAATIVCFLFSWAKMRTWELRMFHYFLATLLSLIVGDCRI